MAYLGRGLRGSQGTSKYWGGAQYFYHDIYKAYAEKLFIF